jgi:hypothetical protein
VFSLAAERRTIKARPRSELALVVRRAAAAGEPILIDTGDIVYVVEVHPASATDAAGVQRDTLFKLVGVADGDEPTDIARYKDEYLAEAYEPRRR